MIEEILEEGGKEYRNTVIMGDLNSVVGDDHIGTLLDHMA
jgi:endonuclease/exonuclease/phosphatase family metal-dependent hydrolase